MTIGDRVEPILKAVPATRSSDKELQIIYMQKAGMNLTPEQIELYKSLPSMETLRRSRQAIQESGKYPATVEVEAERKAKQVYMKRGGFKKPEEVIEKQLNVMLSPDANPFPTKPEQRQPLPW